MVETIKFTEAYTRSGVNIAKSMKFFLGDMIFVLFGKPDVDMGGLLAHEIMHGWFLSQGYNPLEHEKSVDEGICQVMSHKWLDWFSSEGFNSSRKTKEQVQYTRKLKEKLALGLNEWYDDEVYGQGFRNAMRAIKTSGFEATLDHTLKEGTLPPVETTTMRKETASAAITDQLLCKEGTLPPGVTTTMRKKTASAAITELLWKAAGSKTESLWKATTVTITNLLLKATGAICETPRFVAMEGQRHHHYHHGQSHNNLHASMSASPTLLIMFFGILIEHK
uniref:uncharacterized protein LOC105351837 n=1 Tax=Fragaria vesca subsp. vesca TaxID=101020 RepID=UPI0005CAB06D|nr:PREDICTED: uncharacterized protein LOC105351837 [Fragaria vesca subsp. vesca]